MSELDDELTSIFRDEAAGRLDQMEAALLAVESGDAGAESVDSLFRNAHTIKGAAGMLGLDDIRALARAVEEVLAGVRAAGEFKPGLAAPLLRATAVLRAQISGEAEQAASADEVLGDLAASAAALAGDAASATSGYQPAGDAAPDPEPPAHAAPDPAPPAHAAPDSAPPEGARADSAPPQGARPDPAPPEELVPGPGLPEAVATGPKEARRPLRVPAQKIDRLLDVVGAVMQDRGRLAHSLGAQAALSQDVADVLGSSERMLDELRDTAIGLRTLPLETITGRLPLAVRDLCLAAGKDAELVVTGAGTEIDRVILESLYDPLVHLLRNAVSHGIESPAERERAGKPPCGRLEVRAVPRGSLVEIVVTDDGSGVSAETAEQARHEGSLGDVLARAGYSTANEVTDLAGRGVGLDVVRSYARSVGGSFEVRSEPGRGMEVVLLLPVALALLEVLLFERGGGVYGMPLVAVEEIVSVAETLTLEGRAVLEVRGRPLPVVDVAVLIGAAPLPLGRRSPALVISAAGRRCVATCDAVLGKEEVVVKSLGPLLGDVEGYLGAAILGDGRIALLVEPVTLARRARPRPPRHPGPAQRRAQAAQSRAPDAPANCLDRATTARRRRLRLRHPRCSSSRTRLPSASSSAAFSRQPGTRS